MQKQNQYQDIIQKTLNKIVQNIEDKELKQQLIDHLTPILPIEAGRYDGRIYHMHLCFLSDKSSWLKELFPISKWDIEENKNKQFDDSNIELILRGIYNAYMPNGNTYFHSLIANDCTKHTLKILKQIQEKCQRENIDLNKIIPFTLLDDGAPLTLLDDGECKKSECKKNFLMLAISKKYDSNHYIYINEKINKYEEMVDYDKQYQEHDKNLIEWLINNAPTNCIQQTDGDEYNLIDYALMKMDADILKMIIERSKKDDVLNDMINNSQLLTSVINNSFTHKEATALLEERYNTPTAIDEEQIWNEKKDNIIKNILPQLTAISLDDFFSQIETMKPQDVFIKIGNIQQAKQIINEKCQVGFSESTFCCCSTDVCKRKKMKEELLKAIDRIQENSMDNQTPIISLNKKQIQQLSGIE